jgi:polyisoprenyl-teichoic acid--peptidoglycan teichoic acid transferase
MRITTAGTRTGPAALRTRTVRRVARRFLVLGMVLAAAALVVPASSVSSTEMELVEVHRASGVDLSPDVVWILAVGSDARPGEDMTRSRGDALQLVGMNTRTGAATSIGIPRDSYVPIPGHGNEKINAALYFGGPQLLGRAVGDLVGIRPDYVFVTRFTFFIAMVKEIGGIEVRNPRAFADEYLKPRGFDRGRIHLDGYGAMAFSRIRHDLPGGDFDRSANQARVLRGIQAKVRARAGHPGFLDRGVVSVMKHLHTGVGPAQLFRLAQAMSQVEPSKITSCVLRGGIGMAGAASVVFPDRAMARRLGNDARRDAVISRC